MKTSVKTGHASVDEVSGNTRVSTLREVYGEGFLREWPSDTRISQVRQESEMSLAELLRQYQRRKG